MILPDFPVGAYILEDLSEIPALRQETERSLRFVPDNIIPAHSSYKSCILHEPAWTSGATYAYETGHLMRTLNGAQKVPCTCVKEKSTNKGIEELYNNLFQCKMGSLHIFSIKTRWL